MRKIIVSVLALSPLVLSAYSYSSHNHSGYLAEKEEPGHAKVSDDQIRQKIKNELQNTWFGKKYKDINFEVSDGEVILTGIVDSQSDLSTIENRVKDIRGVIVVRNQLRVASQSNGSSGHLSDDQIRRRIKDELTKTWISKSYENVKIDINNGDVSLSGIVEGEGDLGEVEDRIRTIPGVKVIRNQLKIMAAKNGGYQKMNDGEISKKIKEQLTNTWLKKSYKNVNVQVEDGIVILKGVVDSEGDLDEVEERIIAVPGVRVVRNRLQIEE